MIYIYALIDPFTKAIRYVGKSIRPKQRLQNHCNEKAVTYRTNWIKQVLAQGGRPEIAILEELADDADWQACECRWIAFGKEQGWALTNCTDGGDGVPNLPPEIRRRISQVWIGRKHTPEALEKMRKASTGHVHTDAHREKMRAHMTGRKIAWVDKVAKALQKLDDDEVREIRRRLANGDSQYALAEAYCVHQGTISNIKRGITYKDVK